LTCKGRYIIFVHTKKREVQGYIGLFKADLSTTKKIVWAWVCCLGVFALSLLFRHSDVGTLGLVNEALRVLLFICCLYLVRKEPNKKNRFIFFNLAVFFSLSFFHHLSHFVGSQGSILVSQPFSGFFYYQYVSQLSFYFFLALAIIYIVIDSLFRDFRIYQKYLITLVIVGGFTYAYYRPTFENPKYLYTTEDIRDWKALDAAWAKYSQENGLAASAKPDKETLASLVSLHAWKNGIAVGDLYADENVKRIDYLVKYLEGDNYLVLLWKPIHMNVIYMSVVCVFFIILFFGYQYKKDPPQGAYVDKIMFLFLLFCSMEGLHALGYVNALEWSNSFMEVFRFGQYITIGILFFMVLFFSLRLRFVTSVKGEFYESELVHNAEHITRWRDWVDNLVVHYFLNPKALRGRFLALWTEKGKGELAKTAH
jgi:hypothetical protein